MKKVFAILSVLFLSVIVFAQSPSRMSYQAVIRDVDNNLVVNQAVGMKVSIIQGSIEGLVVFEETYTPLPASNTNGLVTVEIGGGEASIGDFGTIDWSDGPYFIKTETDPEGGENYTITGISELLSVPYALHANTAESISGGIPEIDPVFIASPANSITGTNISDWNSAYSWGDHSTEGYLTSYTETDPVFSLWDKSTGIVISESQISDLNHFTNSDEIDPAFSLWDKSTGIVISESQISDLNHFTNSDEIDPVFTLWDKSTGIIISESQISDLNHFTNSDETDPVFIASPANSISGTNILDWNSAYSWGDHSIEGYLTSYTETDPVFTLWDKSTGIIISESQISDLNHFTNSDEIDPVFTLWDKSTGIIISESQISDLNHFTNSDETDPIFVASPANSITGTNIIDWNSAYGWGDHSTEGYLTSYTETDPQVGSNTTNYLSKWNGTELTTSNIYDDGNVGIGTESPTEKFVVVGTNGDGRTATFDNNSSDDAYITIGKVLVNQGGYLKYKKSSNYIGMGIHGTSEQLVLNGVGNVGIGTTSPGSALHVAGLLNPIPNSGSYGVHAGTCSGFPSAGLEIVSGPVGTGWIDFHVNGSANGVQDMSCRIFADASSALSFYTGSQGGTGFERLYISSAGNVGVGTNSPSTKLSVNGVITATGGNSTNWNTSYGWGDHSTQGYLTSFTEVDPMFSSWDKSTGILISESQISDLNHFTNSDETDPIYGASVASGITGTDTTNWNTKQDQLVAGTNISIVGNTISATEGDFYLGQDTLGGIVFYIYHGSDKQQHGLIVSKTETTAQWQSTASTTNASRSWDGSYNMNLMTNSPAKDWITANFSTDWYLPSIDELGILWSNRFHANKALHDSGATLLLNAANYWSSTEYDASNAFYFYINSGNPNFPNKANVYSVRAVRTF